MAQGMAAQQFSGGNREVTLTNPWLTISRLFWFVVVGAVIFILISQASRGSRMLFAESIVEDSYAALASTITYANYARLILASRYFVVGIFMATGLFIFWRKSNTVMGLVASLEVILLPLLAGLGGRSPIYAETLGMAFGSLVMLLEGSVYVVWLFVTLLFVGLFPNGYLPGRRLAVLALAYMILLLSIATSLDASDWDVSVGWVAGTGVLFLGVVVSIGAAIYRYFRISTPIEKQQTRWVMASLILVALWSALVAGENPFRGWDSRAAPFALFQIFGTVVVSALVPLSIAAAITRYHLWDIDVVIRKTLIYALLTGTLLAIYLVSILALQRLFTAVTGQNSTLTTILSTLLIAALFLPLRRRIQSIIDRRFFRSKYDAAKVLEDFAATARDETDLDKLTAELLRVIQETMQPEHVSIWLREETADGEHAPKVTFQGYFGEPPVNSG